MYPAMGEVTVTFIGDQRACLIEMIRIGRTKTKTKRRGK